MSDKLAIVGGGPVGLYLAIKLAKQGHDVSLFEKSNWPIDKVCGQGIMPSGVELLQDIGFNFSRENSYEFDGVEYIDRDLIVKARLETSGRGISRNELSKELFNITKNYSNIGLFPNTRISNIKLEERKYSIEFDSKYHSYDYIFACDGLNSNLRKLLNNESNRLINNRVGARVHFNMPPWSKYVQVFWNSGVEAYVTPVSHEKIEIAFLWFDDKIQKGNKLDEKLFKLFPKLCNKLDFDKIEKDFKGHSFFKYYSDSIHVMNVFFIGDAYKFLDGITGEGISLGMKTASLIANNYHNFKLKHKIKIHLLYLNYSIWVYLALLLSKHSTLRRLIFKFLNKFNWPFKKILKLNDLKI